MKRVFFSSADVISPEVNRQKYLTIGKYAAHEYDMCPIIPQLNSLFLDYTKFEDIIKGILASKEMVFFANEMWIIGEEMGEHMENEIRIAEILKIPIVHISDAEVRRILKKYGGTKYNVEEI